MGQVRTDFLPSPISESLPWQSWKAFSQSTILPSSCHQNPPAQTEESKRSPEAIAGPVTRFRGPLAQSRHRPRPCCALSTVSRPVPMRHPGAQTRRPNPRKANAPPRRFWARTPVSGGRSPNPATGRGPVPPFPPFLDRYRCVILAPTPAGPIRGRQTLPRGDFGPAHLFLGPARPIPPPAAAGLHPFHQII